MTRSDQHLLYVLSQPLVPVRKGTSHRWTAGDVILVEEPSTRPPRLFLILDVTQERQTLALRLSDRPDGEIASEGYVSLGPNGLGLSEPGFVSASHSLQVDKFYFEHHIAGSDQASLSFRTISHFSEQSLAKIKETLAKRWLQITDPAALSTPSASVQSDVFESVISSSDYLARFLDFVYLEFDKRDYSAVRECLRLPKTLLTMPASLDCHCEAHKNKRCSQTTYNNFSVTFFSRTWLKIIEGVKRLELEGEPAKILEKLSATARFLGYQPGERIAHRMVPKPCFIQQLPTELLLNIVESIPLHWEKLALLNFGLTCKFFYQLVNVSLYTSIAISCKDEKWDKVAHMLPKHGHLTKEIYLEAPSYDDITKKAVFKNLRAIGDFCPRLERLDLNYPMRLDLAATEADLPPKLTDLSGPSSEQQPESMEVDKDSASAEPEDQNDGDGQVNNDTPAVIDTTNHNEDTDTDDNDHGNDGDTVESDLEPLDDDDLVSEQAYETEIRDERRVCAEIDHIIKNCPLLNTFSMQWTGKPALDRFYHKIPKLRGLRLWDRNVNDQALIATGTHCRDLERFYLDGQDAYNINLDGLIGMLNGLRTKKESKLKRLGIYHVHAFEYQMDGLDGMLSDDDDTDDDDDDEGHGEDDDMAIDEDNDAVEAPVNDAPPPAGNQPRFDVRQSPLYKYLDVLSLNHPFLERLALIGCAITDDIIPILGRFEHLQSLDIHNPIKRGPRLRRLRGLSEVGLKHLVDAFQGHHLASLDLSGHDQMSEDNMDILTGATGLKSLRYVRVAKCPKLKKKYLCDEWVHPDDLVMSGGSWRPRDGAGKGSLEIGDGWKEQWGD